MCEEGGVGRGGVEVLRLCSGQSLSPSVPLLIPSGSQVPDRITALSSASAVASNPD